MTTKLLTPKNIIIIASVILLFLLFYFIKRLYRKSVRQKELRQQAQDRQREEKLDAILRNPQADAAQAASGSVPYEVDYSQEKKQAGNTAEGQEIRMLQLTENNVLSRRKHMLSLEKPIHIGSGAEGNAIVVPDVCPCQCEIFQYKGGVYLKETGEKQLTVLQRKKKKVYAERKGIRLQTGDRIIFDKISFDITIL